MELIWFNFFQEKVRMGCGPSRVGGGSGNTGIELGHQPARPRQQGGKPSSKAQASGSLSGLPRKPSSALRTHAAQPFIPQPAPNITRERSSTKEVVNLDFSRPSKNDPNQQMARYVASIIRNSGDSSGKPMIDEDDCPPMISRWVHGKLSSMNEYLREKARNPNLAVNSKHEKDALKLAGELEKLPDYQSSVAKSGSIAIRAVIQRATVNGKIVQDAVQPGALTRVEELRHAIRHNLAYVNDEFEAHTKLDSLGRIYVDRFSKASHTTAVKVVKTSHSKDLSWVEPEDDQELETLRPPGGRLHLEAEFEDANGLPFFVGHTPDSSPVLRASNAIQEEANSSLDNISPI
jgi:hypothetical protein